MLKSGLEMQVVIHVLWEKLDMGGEGMTENLVERG